MAIKTCRRSLAMYRYHVKLEQVHGLSTSICVQLVPLIPTPTVDLRALGLSALVGKVIKKDSNVYRRPSSDRALEYR